MPNDSARPVRPHACAHPADSAGLCRLLALAILVLGMSLAGQATAQEVVATVVRADGDTWLVRAGKVATPIKDTQVLRAGDRLSTGPRGRVDIRYEDGMVMAMGRDSSLTIERYRQAGRQSEGVFSLARGSLRTITGLIGKLNPPGFQLRTPTAVMGVRGTDFSVWQRDCRRQACDPDDAPPTELQVHSGRVVMSTRGGQIEVPPGKRAVVGRLDALPQLAENRPARAPLPPARPTRDPADVDESERTPEHGMHMLR